MDDKDIMLYCIVCTKMVDHLFQSSGNKFNVYSCSICRFNCAVSKALVKRNQLELKKHQIDFPPLIKA